MMISADRPAEPLLALASTAWLRGCAQARSAPSYASTHRGSRGMAEIGTICSNYADLSKPASLIWTGSIIPVGRTTGFFWV